MAFTTPITPWKWLLFIGVLYLRRWKCLEDLSLTLTTLKSILGGTRTSHFPTWKSSSSNSITVKVVEVTPCVLRSLGPGWFSGCYDPLFPPWHQVHKLSALGVLMACSPAPRKVDKGRRAGESLKLLSLERVKDDLFHSETCARVATKPHRAKGNSICHGFVKSYRSGKMLILVGLWPYCLSIFHVVISAGTLAAKYTGPRLIVLIPVFELRSIYTPEQTRRARSHFPNSSAPGCLIFKYHRNSYWFYLVSQWILT